MNGMRREGTTPIGNHTHFALAYALFLITLNDFTGTKT